MVGKIAGIFLAVALSGGIGFGISNSNANNKIENLNNTVIEQETEMSDLRNSLNESTATKLLLQGRLDEITAELETKKEELAKANSDLADLNSELESIKEELAENVSKVQDLEYYKIEAEGTITALQSDVSTLNLQISEIQTQLETSHDNETQLQAQLTEKLNLLTQKETELQTAQTQLQTIQSELRTAQNTITEKQERIAYLETDVRAYESMYDALNDENNVLTMENIELNNQIFELENEIANLQEQIVELQSQLENASQPSETITFTITDSSGTKTSYEVDTGTTFKVWLSSSDVPFIEYSTDSDGFLRLGDDEYYLYTVYKDHCDCSEDCTDVTNYNYGIVLNDFILSTDYYLDMDSFFIQSR